MNNTISPPPPYIGRSDRQEMVGRFHRRIYEIFHSIECVQEIHYRTEEPITLLKMENRREFTICWNLHLGQLVFEPILQRSVVVDDKTIECVGFCQPKKMVTQWSQSDADITKFFLDRFHPYFDFTMDKAEDMIAEMAKALLWKNDTLEMIAQAVGGHMDGDVVKWQSQFLGRSNAALVDDPEKQVVRLVLDVDISQAMAVIAAWQEVEPKQAKRAKVIARNGVLP